MPHAESEHEHLALQHWHGRGAVRLLRADPHRSAMLLERLHPTDLTDAWDVEACEVVAGLYPRLHVPAPPQLRTLSSCVEEWTERLTRLPRDAPVPRRLVEQAASLGRTFAVDPATDGRLLHTDLHYENVLATLPGSDRPAWLAIDPHAMAGHPAVEIQPLLRNRVDEYGTGSTFRWQVRRRLEVACEAAGIDEELALAWSYVVTAMEARWAAENGDDERVSFAIALLKALDG